MNNMKFNFLITSDNLNYINLILKKWMNKFCLIVFKRFFYNNKVDYQNIMHLHVLRPIS